MKAHVIKGKQPTATMEEAFEAVLRTIARTENGEPINKKAHSAAEDYGFAIRNMLLDTGWLEIIKVGQDEFETKR